jgi:flagellin
MSDVSLSKAVRTNLLSLQNTASMMNKTQERLATGNKVNSALDNPSNFFTASALNSRAADMNNLLDSMASGIKVLEAANNGLTALTKNLESMQSTLRQARQDKSFQTKSFDVTENSIINLSGGQLGNSVSAISLATATVAGEKAQLTTEATTAYRGPEIDVDAEAGAGARTIISANGGFSTGDRFTVAGVEVEATGATPDAASLAANIKSALNANQATAGKYTVSVGAADSANAGKIVIETIDPNADAASINLDPDNNPASGVTAATKGQTTFNYSSINSQITVGSESIATGTTFGQFVTNLEAKSAELGYSVTANAETGDITLTALKNGDAAPNVVGVPTASGFEAGEKSVTTFRLGNTAGALNFDQEISVSGIDDPIVLTAGMDSDAVLEALEGNEDLAAAYNIAVDANLNVTLTEKTASATAATVTSSRATIEAQASTTEAVGGLDFADDTGNANDNALMTLAGTSITLTSGTNTSTVTIGPGGGEVATVANFISGLQADGFSVEATENGFVFSRADGADFTIDIAGGPGNGLGLGDTNITVNNGTTAQVGGITAAAASITGASGDDMTDDTDVGALDGTEITLSFGEDSEFSFEIQSTTTSDQLLAALNTNGFTVTATNGGLNISRADGQNFTISASANLDKLGFATTADATSTNGVQANTQTNGEADTPAVAGQTVTQPSTTGAFVETAAATKNQFSVSYDGKTATVTLGAVKGGSGPDAVPANDVDVAKWQAATIASVNNQLEAAGIQGVEATFDNEGKFSLVAKAAEAKTIAVSGRDSVALFGTDGVKTGVAEKSELNATKTVDKFVELINRDHGGSVRASNDNGKLRIENLSTQALDIGVDTNGNDVISKLNVAGNSVRDNLHKQFNELRDQMDKLSDDASFNGINLLRGDKLTITFNESGTSSINIQSKDKSENARSINASNLGIDSLVAMDLDSDEGIDAFLGKISAALSDIRSQASSFGSNLSSVENRQTFTKSMINTLQTGAANLTLADMNEEAANLLALQTRQSLSSSALSMASQADQSILQLLR